MFLTDDILPPPPEGAVPVLHNREYRIQSYRLATGRLLIQGALRDQKPPGLFVTGDPEPLTIHHMTLAIEIQLPDANIVAVNTYFPTHPQPECPSIVDRYNDLIGLSIARGFTHKVRELFGGPRGCSHTTALLQAMAPIAMQSFKGMEIIDAAEQGLPHPLTHDSGADTWERLINTCHVWAEGSQRVELVAKHGMRVMPMSLRERLDELGRGDQ